MILNGHDVKGSLARLADVEANFRDLAGTCVGEAVFRVAGRWLVEEGYLHGLLRSSLARVLRTSPRAPVVGDLGVVPLALAAISGPRIRGRNTAVAVCFKSNVRAFYLGARAVTLKMANPVTRGHWLRTEIETRKRLGKPTGVVLPQVIASNGEATHPYLWEEIVFGRRLDPKRDGELFRCHVLPRILDFYEGGGVQCVAGTDFLDLEQLTADVLKAAEQVPWSAKWMDRELFRTRVASCSKEADKYLLVGRGHGDLSCGNILITEDRRACLLDWTRSREQILMQDLEKLFQRYPGSWELAVDRLGSWRPDGIDPDRIMSCSRQAMLGSLQMIQYFSKIRQEHAAPDTEWNRQLARKCDRVLVKQFTAATRLTAQGRL